MRKGLTCDDVLLVPAYSQVYSRKDITLYPFMFSSPMDMVTGKGMVDAMLDQGQMPVVSRFLKDEEWNQIIEEHKHNVDLWIAVPGNETELRAMLSRLDAHGMGRGRTPLNVVVDIAVGHGVVAGTAYKILHKHGVSGLMSGSIATKAGAIFCIRAGCTHLRVGIGPGSMCTTRTTTGCGVPQLTAVMDVAEAVEHFPHVAIVADGGIRNPGDAAKYLAAGAQSIMLGQELARCKEAPGWMRYPKQLGAGEVFIPGYNDFVWAKPYRGQASADFYKSQKSKPSDAPEGESTMLEYEGDYVETTINKYKQGLRSAVSYTGGTTLLHLNPQRVEMIEVSASTIQENKAHGKN